MNEFLYNPSTQVESVTIAGVSLRQGDRVRIRPKARADAVEIALAGRMAFIESIEVDVEDRTHLALVLDDDPGRDRMPGHRFFSSIDDVEPLEGE